MPPVTTDKKVNIKYDMIDTDFFKRNANFFAFKAICVAAQ